MDIPVNGGVVIIDDQEKEALPLLKVLAKNGVPVSYFKIEDPEELPVQPLQNIRLLFLDLQLVQSTDEKTILSSLKGNLEKIISKENGPYVLILWSMHDFKYKNIIEKLFDETLPDLKPVVQLNLQKADYFETEPDGTKTPIDNFMEEIEKKLLEELEKIGAFHLLISWENTVHHSAAQLVNNFFSFNHYQNENWNVKLAGVIKALAVAYAGKQLAQTNEAIFKNGLLTFNQTFLDTLETNIRKTDYSRIKMDGNIPQGNEPDDDNIATLNNKLLLVEHVEDNDNRPGNVYLENDAEKLNELTRDVFNGQLEIYDKKNELLSKSKCISLEVSPLCDFAQDKWKLSRLLPGLMWPVELISKIKNADSVYKSTIFKIEKNLYHLVFDFRYFTAVSFGQCKEKKLLFRVRNELLVEIQSRLARHMNRPGVTSIERSNKK